MQAPKAPPVYRPNGAVQPKPVAPPVYRPQAASPAVAQRKPAYPPVYHPQAQPVYRPQAQPVYRPQAQPVYRPQAQQIPARGVATVQAKAPVFPPVYRPQAAAPRTPGHAPAFPAPYRPQTPARIQPKTTESKMMIPRARAAAQPQGRVILRYKHLVEATAFPETRYSDDETMYVRGPQELYATEDLVRAANLDLARANSLIRLRYVGGERPPIFLTHLGRVYPEIDRGRAAQFQRTQASENRSVNPDAPFSTLSDCHVTSQMVMGSLDSQRGSSLEVANLGLGGLVKPTEGGEPIANRLATGVIGDWTTYKNSAKDQGGINERIPVEVGLALTQINHPGEKARASELGRDAWNFHWAGIILTTDTDYVILENFALDNLNLVWNDKWRFRMHGRLNPDQSFHRENASGRYATETTLTLAVRSVEPEPPRARSVRKKCSTCQAEFDTAEQLMKHKREAH